MAGNVEPLQEDILVEFFFIPAEESINVDNVLIAFGELNQSLL